MEEFNDYNLNYSFDELRESIYHNGTVIDCYLQQDKCETTLIGNTVFKVRTRIYVTVEGNEVITKVQMCTLPSHCMGIDLRNVKCLSSVTS